MTINAQTLQGSWHELRGKLKEKWGTLTDDDLRTFDGNTEQLVGRIQRKTGEARENIENFLGEVSNSASSVLNQAYSAVEQGMHQVNETVQHSYQEAEHLVQQRPAQAVLLSFGVGMVAGLGLAFLMHDRSHDSFWPPNRRNVEHLGRHVLEALARMLPA